MDESISAAPLPRSDAQADGEPRKARETPANELDAKPTRPTAGITFQHLVDKTLHFLSHASNEALGACLVGLGATTYFVLGRVGLVIIGVAGGVVLQATWDGIRHGGSGGQAQANEQERKRETGLQIARRLLDLRPYAIGKGDLSDDTKVFVDQKLDFSSFEPETRKALESFTDSVIKDYVYYWYGPTLPGEESFPNSCKKVFTAFLLSLSGHLQRKRPADVFLDFVTNASSIIIVYLNELAAATNASPHSSSEDAIATYLHLKPESSLAYVLDVRSQSQKLADISEDILQAYVDPKSYNCGPVHIFLKEVLAQLVLGYSVTLCSKPEWINEWIVYGLEESETATKVMNIVDAGVEGGLDKEPQHSRTNSHQATRSTADTTAAAEVPQNAHAGEHKRQMSRAEEAMDEAMQEATRLTQLMIEEDQKRMREEIENSTTVNGSDNASEVTTTTQGAPTPTSSDSDREHRQSTGDQGNGLTASRHVNNEAEIAVSDSISPAAQPEEPSSLNQHVPAAPAISFFNGAAERSNAPLTLHNANIAIFDDSQPGERSSMKAKPTTDYLIQIEPSNPAYPGWMISRKYSDFEMLHEVLRRISVITGVTGFVDGHAALPLWKGNTKADLRTQLETYLIDAAKYQPLAESEGMKRFLERDRGLNKSPTGKGFGWPSSDGFGKLGGDVMTALTKAPKNVAGGVAGGGKAVLGGVAGLVGAGKRPVTSQTASVTTLPAAASTTSLENASPTTASSTSEVSINSPGTTRQSQDSLAGSPAGPLRPAFSRQLSKDGVVSIDSKSSPMSARSSVDIRQPAKYSGDIEKNSQLKSTSSPNKAEPSLRTEEEMLDLPPPPSEMPADYDSPKKAPRTSHDAVGSTVNNDDARDPPDTPIRNPKTRSRPKEPLTDPETSVAVELMFAVVSELYTLSSAWNFRRTLLTAAKTYLLRPGNPQLTAIRDLIQNSLLDANLSDSGLAAHVIKMRENALPTEEELEIWKRDYPEKSPEQKEELRIKARKLLVTRGMPQALTSVMGAAASGEALGKVFDCLQVESVSRGLVFGLMLQALKVVTH